MLVTKYKGLSLTDLTYANEMMFNGTLRASITAATWKGSIGMWALITIKTVYVETGYNPPQSSPRIRMAREVRKGRRKEGSLSKFMKL